MLDILFQYGEMMCFFPYKFFFIKITQIKFNYLLKILKNLKSKFWVGPPGYFWRQFPFFLFLNNI